MSPLSYGSFPLYLHGALDGFGCIFLLISWKNLQIRSPIRFDATIHQLLLSSLLRQGSLHVFFNHLLKFILFSSLFFLILVLPRFATIARSLFRPLKLID